MSVLTNGCVYQNMNVVLYSVLFLFALLVSLVLLWLSNVCFICFTVVVVSIRGGFFFADTILSLKMCFVCFSAVVLCSRDVFLFASWVLLCLFGMCFICLFRVVLSIGMHFICIIFTVYRNALCVYHWLCSVYPIQDVLHCFTEYPESALFHSGCHVYPECDLLVSLVLFC